MKDQIIHVVVAYRWGDVNNHSYVVGVYSNKEKALNAAGIEYSNRGGKYECHITEHEIDFIEDLEDFE
jgi:hypothetical protein